ncbi:MAG TPA: DUF4375 domain-containing protein [Thermoanaerobaculia bacterium]|nr:DUF4375 domain-containing protein [Thermoanaerobaculia bacterium]
MKIAAAYFERLLASTDATGALTQLDQVWCARPGVSSSRSRFGLSEPEYDIHLVLLYSGAVMNGGHAQFLEGPLASFAADTVLALHRSGLADLAAVLESAAGLTISLRVADATFDAASAGIDPALLQYARLHRDEICVPERDG